VAAYKLLELREFVISSFIRGEFFLSSFGKKGLHWKFFCKEGAHCTSCFVVVFVLVLS
jgi:ferredoxin